MTERYLRTECRLLWLPVAILCLATIGGCRSLAMEGSSAAAGIAGAAIAQKVSDNAAVTAGIGVGVQAVARSAMQYTLRTMHGKTQMQIAQAAGPLAVGEVGYWVSSHAVPLEAEEQGRVTVSRVISLGSMSCKEIIYSVDRAPGAGAKTPEKNDALDGWVAEQQAGTDAVAEAFYVASVCKNGNDWVWATSEPAVSRWGALQ